MVEVGDRYRSTRLRVTELVASLGPDELTRRVPACPDWTVHDLVAHVTGVTDDALHGRLDGVGTDPWAAAQVERGRDVPTADLVARWSEQGPVFEQLPLPPQAVIDLTTHEHDIRGAVGRPGFRDSEELCWAFEQVARRAVVVTPGLRIEVGEASFGATESPCVFRGERFELYRALLGRRSAAQVWALDWSGEPPERIEDVVIFGPAGHDVVE